MAEITGAYQRSNTDWFHSSKWGVFCHYLAALPSAIGGASALTSDTWNRTVDGFDVKGLAAQLASAQVKYFFITIGQNTGYFCSPNKTYDTLVPNRPSRLSQRDLVADLYDALSPYGIRLMVYLPSHAPAEDRVAVEGLKCTPHWDASSWQLMPGRYIADADIDERLSAFQRNWEAIVREWSLRWGNKVWGWWVDGCYYADRMYRNVDAPNFRSFAEAMKAGNSESIVTFNSGVKIICYSEYEDYTAGEIGNMLPVSSDSLWNKAEKPADYWCKPPSRFLNGSQYHILTYMGDYWCGGHVPRFPDEMTIGYTRHINSFGGVISWDVPIGRDGKGNGLIPEPFLRQLRTLGSAIH